MNRRVFTSDFVSSMASRVYRAYAAFSLLAQPMSAGGP